MKPLALEPRITPIMCFRCGECCLKRQVLLTLPEIKHIVDDLGLSFDVFLDRYVDQRWHGIDNFLLNQRDGACIFLEHTVGNKTACLIQRVKPVTCRLWTPGTHRRECRDGLAKYWGLTVGHTGQLEGSEDKLGDFQSFVQSLALF